MTKGQVLVCAALAFCASVEIASAQSLQPSFDVASVKENTSASDTAAFGIMPPTPGRIRIINTPLQFILHHAFQVRAHQLIGAPDWTESTSFDITATFPADPLAPTTTGGRSCEQWLLNASA